MNGAHSRQEVERKNSGAVQAVLAVDRGIHTFSRHWLAYVNASFLWFAALPVLAPFLRANGHETWAAPIYGFFRFTCHQRPDRTFSIAGERMACCERCAAIYSTLFLAGLAFALRRRLRPLPIWGVALFSLPMLLDGGTQLIGLRESMAILRVTTGALFSIGVIWLVMPFLEAGFGDMRMQLERRFARLAAEGRARPLRGARSDPPV